MDGYEFTRINAQFLSACNEKIVREMRNNTCIGFRCSFNFYSMDHYMSLSELLTENYVVAGGS